MKRVHSDKLKDSLHKCSICGASFFRKGWFNQHMMKNHPDGQIETFVCDLDAKIFTKKKYLRCHMRKHWQKVECKFCHLELTFRSMTTHMKTVHGTRKVFQCEICNSSFNTKHNLIRHERIHDKKFSCKICNKKYAEKEQLNKHQNHFHENLKTQTCDICGKKFADKANLKQHLNIHDENRPRPFKCQRCGHAATTMQRYKKHLKSHEYQDKRIAAMKNPQKCDQCSTLCKDKFALHIHRINVHTVLIHQCDLCGKYFKNRTCLQRHINRTHLKR
jgi:KRAB domain-containing zinc finger protein